MSSPAARLGPFAVVRRDCVASTNDEARARALSAPGVAQVIWALRQTAGRGRRGRLWESLDGNLFASFLVWPACAMDGWAQASFAAALAVADTVGAAVGPAGAVTLKWPNDVLLGGGKVSGILLESAPSGPEAATGLVIGVGLNVDRAPGRVAGATCLAAWAPPPPLGEILRFLAERLAHWLAAWEKGGFAALRDPWRQRAEGMGEAIRVRLGDRTLEGTFSDLDRDGALLLADPDGRIRRIEAGEVLLAAG